MGHPRPLFVHFCPLKQTLKLLQQKKSIQYMVLGFEHTTFGSWVSSHNQQDQGSHPIEKYFAAFIS